MLPGHLSKCSFSLEERIGSHDNFAPGMFSALGAVMFTPHVSGCVHVCACVWFRVYAIMPIYFQTFGKFLTISANKKAKSKLLNNSKT